MDREDFMSRHPDVELGMVVTMDDSPPPAPPPVPSPTPGSPNPPPPKPPGENEEPIG